MRSLYVVAPLFVEPFVERVHRYLGELRVVEQSLLDQARQRGEHQRRLDALFVEELESRSGLPECGYAGHWLTRELAE